MHAKTGVAGCRRWSVNPQEGLGHLPLGTLRSEVRAAMACAPVADSRRRWGIASEVDIYFGEELLVHFDGEQRARILEINRPLQAHVGGSDLIGISRVQLARLCNERGWTVTQFEDDKRRPMVAAQGIWFTFTGGSLATVAVARPQLLEPLHSSCRPWRC